MSSNPRPPARPIPWLQIARLAWAALALVTIALYAWGLTYELNEPATMCRASTNVPCVESEAAARLEQLGFPAWYPQFLAVLNDSVVPLVYLAVALLIFWRARQSWLGLAASALLLSSGGMPSSHSALVIGVCIAAGLTLGFDTPVFAVAFVLAMIVVYDATGVRRHAGDQARVINLMIDELLTGHPLAEKELKEVLGHTPREVLAGILLGAVIAYLTVRVF